MTDQTELTIDDIFERYDDLVERIENGLQFPESETFDDIKSLLTRLINKREIESRIDELNQGPWTYDGNEFGDHYAHRLNELEQQLKSLNSNEESGELK